MANTQLVCPYCNSTVNFGHAIAAGTAVECLICMKTFAANPSAAVGAAEETSKAFAAPTAPRPSLSVAASKKGARASTTPANTDKRIPNAGASPESHLSEAGSNAALYAVFFVLLLLVGGGIGFAIWKAVSNSAGDNSNDPNSQLAANGGNGLDKKEIKKDEGKSDQAGTEKKKKEDAQQPKIDPPGDEGKEKTPKKKEESNSTLIRKDKVKKEEKEPEIDPIVKIEAPKKVIPGLDQAKINDAIDRGIAYLKRAQDADGSWKCISFPVGVASLAGLTLLESGVPAKDPTVQRAAAYVRANAGALRKTYDAATALLFLDRLGEPADRSIIRSLAVQLFAGQQYDGAWGYESPSLSDAQGQSLLSFLQSHKKGAGKGPMRIDALSPALRGLVVVQAQGTPKGKLQLRSVSMTDNSNTQFALLALWTARRHDVPADQAILASYQRFALTQVSDGGWGYTLMDMDPTGKGPPMIPQINVSLVPGKRSTESMTCVGLLGLALGHGVAPDGGPAKADNPKPALQDKKIENALAKLSGHIGEPVGAGNLGSLTDENLYFLWSVERVAMLYNLDYIGKDKKDWYAWGAQILVQRQQADGDWNSKFYVCQQPTVNTCFALLFLRRSNLVQDLTTTLRFNSGILDPQK